MDKIKQGYALKHGSYIFILSKENVAKNEYVVFPNTLNGKLTNFEGCNPQLAQWDYSKGIYNLKIIASNHPGIKLKYKIRLDFINYFESITDKWLEIEYAITNNEIYTWKNNLKPNLSKKQIKLDKAIKYVQDSYCTDRLNMPYMLLGDVAELIKILTGKEVDTDLLEKFKK